jgi:hypothetical protein
VSDNVVVLGPDGLVELTASGEGTESGGSDKDIGQGDSITDQVGLVLEILVQELELLLNLGEDRGEGLKARSENNSVSTEQLRWVASLQLTGLA